MLQYYYYVRTQTLGPFDKISCTLLARARAMIITQMAEENSEGKEGKKEEPVYFYMDNGLIVFTDAYHLKRGYCCGSGCRHCPWKNVNPGKN